MSVTARIRADLRRASREAASRTKDFSTPPIPVLDIAETSGVDVVFDPFSQYSGRVSGFCDFAERRIYVNDDDSFERQRFTIAHELGHWVLHRELFESEPQRYAVLPRFSSPDFSDPIEQEANRFAADLLVPSHLLRPVKDVPPARLASIFEVSRQMMEIRLKRV